MANSEHVEFLAQGMPAWNSWRRDNPAVSPDLREITLSRANLKRFNLSQCALSSADLREANLYGANLSDADLSGGNLSGANLGGAHLVNANLSSANLVNTCLASADFSRANLSGATFGSIELRGFDLSAPKLHGANLRNIDLRGSNLCRADLSGFDLCQAKLSRADLSEVNLSRADLSEADLSEVSFVRAQVLSTNFSGAILTAACLEDWNVNSSTDFSETVCDYVYLKADQRERRPREGNFKPGEFAALFQQALDTVDLIFKDGIDWQAFFQSFQDLRSQYADQELAIQAIEKKQGGAFVVRLEVAEGADKSAIESSAKQLYESKLVALEAQYEKQLRLQGEQHSADIQRLIEAERQEKATLMGVLSTMASNQGPKYNLSNAQFAGGFAETVQGDQEGGIINNYGTSAADIERLITVLRDQVQAFPEEHKDDALDTLEVLQGEIAKPEPDKARIGRWVKRLGEIATLTAATTAAATGFTADLAQLADYLEVPAPEIIQVEPE